MRLINGKCLIFAQKRKLKELGTMCCFKDYQTRIQTFKQILSYFSKQIGDIKVRRKSFGIIWATSSTADSTLLRKNICLKNDQNKENESALMIQKLRQRFWWLPFPVLT